MGAMERIFIKIIPIIVKKSMSKIEKLNLTTKALEVAYENERIRKGDWKKFCLAFESFFKDCASEAHSASMWNTLD